MKDFTIFFFLFSNTNFYYDRFIIKRFHQNHVFEEHIKWRKNKHLNSKHVNRKITLRVNLFKSTKHYGPYKSVHHSFISFLIDHQKSSKNYNMLFYFESDIKNKNGCVFNFKPTTRINNEYSDCDARCHQGPRTKERKKTWSPNSCKILKAVLKLLSQRRDVCYIPPHLCTDIGLWKTGHYFLQWWEMCGIGLRLWEVSLEK